MFSKNEELVTVSEQFNPQLEILRELYLPAFKRPEDIRNWLNKVYKQAKTSSDQIGSFHYLTDELFKNWKTNTPNESHRKPTPVIAGGNPFNPAFLNRIFVTAMFVFDKFDNDNLFR